LKTKKLSSSEKIFIKELEVLKQSGIVKDWLFEPVSACITEGLYKEIGLPDKKGKYKRVAVIRPQRYTPDFIVFWNKEVNNTYTLSSEVLKTKDDYIAYTNEELKDVIELTDEYYYSIVEIKPKGYDKQNMTRLFMKVRALFYEKYKICVNLRLR